MCGVVLIEGSRDWPDEQRLLRRLLRNYDTAGRPVYNASHTVTVQFGLTLTQIADMVGDQGQHTANMHGTALHSMSKREWGINTR